ncbi:hypothetical protein BH11BAC2_BH11BAC2_01200 [soil metagenome]
MRTLIHQYRLTFRFSGLISCFLLLLSGNLSAQNNPIPDEQLREQLTRAVQLWQQGQAFQAYTTLDSIQMQITSPENAGSKVKSAIWTATYLQAQKKFKPAVKFLDSALTWAEQYARGEELRRAYDAYAQYYQATGNVKGASAAQQASLNIKDSLTQLQQQKIVDSLNVIISASKAENEKLNSAVKANEGVETDALKKSVMWNWVLGIIIGVLLVIVFLMNGNLQRLKAAPPAPAPYIPSSKVEKELKVNAPVTASPSSVPPLKKPAVAKTESKETDARAIEMSKDIKDLTARLSKVELILIRPEMFSQQSSGDSKLAVKTLEEYVTNLPSIMRSLDDAIAENKADGILLCIGHIKPFLIKFGMEGTLLWITEIESEAPDAKVNKLLSRVFQVRNHVRRAQDEAKAILEKVSF